MQRYYDPEIGRFISPDPVGPEEDFVKHFNRYVYAYDNPVRYTDPDGRSALGWAKRAWKFIRNGGNAAATFADVKESIDTLRDPEASAGEKFMAGASLASEVAPVSVGDFKDAGKVMKMATESKFADNVKHIFGQAKYKMDAVVERFGSKENGLAAIDDAAQKALKDGKLNLNAEGINTSTRVDVGGLEVDLVGGKVVDGKFEIGSASRRDIK